MCGVPLRRGVVGLPSHGLRRRSRPRPQEHTHTSLPGHGLRRGPRPRPQAHTHTHTHTRTWTLHELSPFLVCFRNGDPSAFLVYLGNADLSHAQRLCASACGHFAEALPRAFCRGTEVLVVCSAHILVILMRTNKHGVSAAPLRLRHNHARCNQVRRAVRRSPAASPAATPAAPPRPLSVGPAVGLAAPSEGGAVWRLGIWVLGLYGLPRSTLGAGAC